MTACIVTNRIIVGGLQKEDLMPRIAIPKREDAPVESKPILDNVEKMLGFVPNLQRLMSISPNTLSGWAALMGSLAKTLDVRTRDGIALGVSEADGCDYCVAAHSFIASNLAKIPADEIELNREGRSSDPKRQAAVAFAKALIETRGKVSDAQFAAIRDAGWTDANIVEIIALTAQFLLTNFMPGMTGVELHRHLVDAGYAIPTILVTAYPDEVVRDQAVKDGVVCYLSKPVDDHYLERCLRSALRPGSPIKGNS